MGGQIVRYAGLRAGKSTLFNIGLKHVRVRYDVEHRR